MMDTRFHSRKFIFALMTWIFASLMAAVLSVAAWPTIPALLSVMYWWTSVTGGIFTLYGGTSIIDKKLNPNGG